MADDQFDLWLGRIGQDRPLAGRMRAAINRAGGIRSGRRSGFTGARMGRGAGMGAMLSSQSYRSGKGHRRVIVKARIVKLAGKGLAGAVSHLRYLQRDGTTRDGERGQLYGPGDEPVDGNAFLDRGSDDRHQFRFIVAPEDGAEYEDLKPLVRRWVAAVEQDLGTKLDWVAVDHFDTGTPHTYIVVRGRDDRNQNLVIAREYIGRGIRERVAELVTLDLGPRTTLEIEDRLRHDIDGERLTPIDRRMVREMDANREVGQSMRDPFQQSLRVGRLRKLEDLGLAEPVGGGRWRLADGVEETLRRTGERGDIIRTMQREMTARGRAGVEQQIFDPGAGTPLTGRVIARGLADELHDRHYLLVDGTDGRSHYVEVGRGDTIGPTPTGSIVRVAPARGGAREADRTVAEIAAANGEHYTIDLHLQHDPTASEAFAQTHVRRLEAIRRSTGGVTREPDGSWMIAPDHLDRVEAYEARLARDRPVTVETISQEPIDRLATIDAATWLDRRIAGEDAVPIRDAGFGREVRQADMRRRQWLIEQGLADERDGAVRLRAGALEALSRRELLRVAGQLSDELGLAFVEARPGERIEGVVRRPIDTLGGKLALIEKSHEFALVLWRPALERQIGRPVSGIVRGDTVSWSFGRSRDGPSL